MWVPQVPPFSLPCCEDGASSSSHSLPHKKPPSISLHMNRPQGYGQSWFYKKRSSGVQFGFNSSSLCPRTAILLSLTACLQLYFQSPLSTLPLIRDFFLSFSFQLSFLCFLSFSFHFSELTCRAVFVSGVQYTGPVIPDVTRCSSWQV